MNTRLAEFAPLTERIRAVRDHFVRGGRWSELGLVLLVMVGALLLLGFIHRLRDPARRREPNHPGRLFRTLVRGLGLTGRQQRLLGRMAAELRLEHPTVLLLSPRLFREHTAAWRQTLGDLPEDELTAIERHVFGTGPTEPETGAPG